jgi:hypothetical protein
VAVEVARAQVPTDLEEAASPEVREAEVLIVTILRAPEFKKLRRLYLKPLGHLDLEILVDREVIIRLAVAAAPESQAELMVFPRAVMEYLILSIVLQILSRVAAEAMEIKAEQEVGEDQDLRMQEILIPEAGAQGDPVKVLLEVWVVPV